MGGWDDGWVGVKAAGHRHSLMNYNLADSTGQGGARGHFVAQFKIFNCTVSNVYGVSLYHYAKYLNIICAFFCTFAHFFKFCTLV